VVLFALPMAATSCFTTALWSLDKAERASIEEHVEEYDPEGDQSWLFPLLGRTVLTPFAVVLDVLTAPYQCLVRDDDPVDTKPRTNYRMTSR